MGNLKKIQRLLQDYVLNDELEIREREDERTRKLLADNGIHAPNIDDYTHDQQQEYFDALREYDDKLGYFYVELVNGRLKLK